MAFDLSAISQWNDEVSDRSKIILKPLLGARTMDYVEKVSGITGENVKLPIFETTTPWQAGAGCGFTSSGSTTVTQFSITTSPITINEGICLNDLETKFAKAWLPAGSKHESFDLVNLWVERKQAQISKQIESALWQAKTTYTNATWLKQFNGFISTIDTAGNAVAATQQAAINTTTVRGIFNDMVFQKLPTIPEIFQESPAVFCGMDVFMILLQAYQEANMFHIMPTANEYGGLTFTYPGTNVEVIAVPGLNASNPVDTGVLPTVVKYRIFATYKSNLVVGFNAENDVNSAKVWYSDDNDQLRMKLRFHLGTGVKFTSLVVQYTNS